VEQTTDRLIERLAAAAEPVRRLRPPLLRASLWLLGVAAAGALAIVFFANLPDDAVRMRDPKLMIEMAATLLTGVLAVIAAFHLSVPDRSPLWALTPLPPLVLWIAVSGYECYRHWITFGPDGGWQIGESANCFRFILGVSVPLGLSLFFALRRASPLAPVRVSVVGGLGAAALAAFLLQFFHPFEITFMDLGVHAFAVVVVVTVASLTGRFAARRLSAFEGPSA
jgi:hypothetical protein